MTTDQHSLPSTGTYLLVWLALVALTGLTVTATTLNLGWLSIYTAILLALIKSSLVVLYFMNLKQEQPVFKFMLLIALVTLTAILVLTFVDTALR